MNENVLMKGKNLFIKHIKAFLVHNMQIFYALGNSTLTGNIMNLFLEMFYQFRDYFINCDLFVEILPEFYK